MGVRQVVDGLLRLVKNTRDYMGRFDIQMAIIGGDKSRPQ